LYKIELISDENLETKSSQAGGSS